MDKLWLIIKREYLTRVKKRSFIITTLVTPLAILLFMLVVGVIFSYEGDESKKFAVIDESGILTVRDGNDLRRRIGDKQKMNTRIYFKYPKTSLSELMDNFDKEEYDGIIVLPSIQNLKTKNYEIFYYSDNQLNIEINYTLEQLLARGIRDYKIEKFGMNKDDLKNLETKVNLEPKPISDKGEDASKLTSIVAASIGGFMGFIMYLAVFIYGMMVMRSVMEEKTNRIVEIMISSVKPFQLMLGKIIGVGGVGLTQLAIWAILIPIITLAGTLLFGYQPPQAELAAGMPEMMDPEDAQIMALAAFEEFRRQNWLLIVPVFLIFFVGGYLLYSSLFAAVGSAMSDDYAESQALTIPITIPVVLAFYIMIVAVRSPDSTLAVFASIFPLFSPIVMPARLAFGPPFWQVALSIVLLIATAILFVWITAKIYRVGILMYGKKVSLKELGKWIFYKE